MAQSRREFIKIAKTKGEDARIAIRNVRRHAMADLQKLADDGDAGEDEVRRAEARQNKLPKALRWAVLKRADGRLTEGQVAALAELEASDLFTAIAWRIKEKLRWVRQAQSVQAARWRLTNFLRHANELLDPDPLLDPVRKAIATVETHSKRILQRWSSSHSNARLEGLNGLFQAARARARGYRNITTFATIIYLLAAPLGDLFKST